jgi:dTDP-glucose 4,6-dehydratase
MLSKHMRILVTGGAGFIGSALCRLLVSRGHRVVNVDRLSYAGNLRSLDPIAARSNYRFERLNIADRQAISHLLNDERIEGIVHLAAETHVDRSIHEAEAFIQTNIVGTHRLLEAALNYWSGLDKSRRNAFRFLHVSTDEVFGDLGLGGGAFTETSRYHPSSPYAASKAAADHLVMAWHQTHGLPVLISNCSNNFGPYQFPEKLIPLAILNALHERPIPIYAEGRNVRDWLYVEDHVQALERILMRGRTGETYLAGARTERTNIEVVRGICSVLDARRPRTGGRRHDELIAFVPDRRGHDLRYAVDPAKLETELNWKAAESFESGLSKTIDWYLDRRDWWGPLYGRKTSMGQGLDHSFTQ